MRAPLFLTGLVAGLVYLLPKGLGLLADVGGSRLNRSPTFSLRPDVPALVVLGLFVAAAVGAFLVRRRLAAILERLGDRAERKPYRTALAVAVACLLVHAALFAPFRHNCFRVPDPEDGAFEIRGGGGGRLERVPRTGRFEDNARNYVMARSVRRLGVSRYFSLDEAEELTPIDRDLCRWALTNHPPGYHLFLAPATTGPTAARSTSVALYFAVTVLAFLLIRSLLGGAAAVVGALLFWAVPSNMFFLGMMTPNDLAVAVAILVGLVVLAGSPRPSAVRLVLGGLILGAAFLVKYTAPLALPWVGVLLVWRLGLRSGARAFGLVLVGFLPVAAVWAATLAGTEWGAVQYQKYAAGLVAKALDPSHVGRAESSARGTTLDFLVYIPVELGFPLAATVLVAFFWWLLGPRRAGPEVLVSLLLYGISLAAAFLVIPKTNYFFFALPGLCGLAGAYLSRRSRAADAAALVGVVVVYGILRTVLLGIQTY